jgi:Rhamnan synthesis protein F
MPQTAAIYVIQDTHLGAAHPGHALDRLRAEVDHLIVVGATPDVAAAGGADQIIAFRRAVHSTLSGYKIGLEALYRIGGDWAHLILTGSHVFGPFGDHAALPGILAASDAALFAPYWHDLTLDKNEPQSGVPDRIPYLDYAILGPAFLARPDFREFWSAFRPSDQPEREFRDGLVGFARYCRDAGLYICYPVAETAFETADPRHFEIHKVVAAGGPVLPLSVFFLDPIQHDANAIYLRRALEDLRAQDPALYDLVTGYVVTHMKARDFCMISDQYTVLAGQPDNPGKTAWNFGRIAIFIHAYYANMMPEFWALIQKIPCEVDLFITTSSPEDKAHIEAFLADQGWPADRADVRGRGQSRPRHVLAFYLVPRCDHGGPI